MHPKIEVTPGAHVIVVHASTDLFDQSVITNDGLLKIAKHLFELSISPVKAMADWVCGGTERVIGESLHVMQDHVIREQTIAELTAKAYLELDSLKEHIRSHTNGLYFVDSDYVPTRVDGDQLVFRDKNHKRNQEI